MLVGITERGDAGLDLSWRDRLYKVGGFAILITKNITDGFKQAVLEETTKGRQLIVHCTCTGHGGTIIEPSVPDYETQLNNLKDLIDKGFPKERCVLRVDPIIPEMLDAPKQVLDYARVIGLLPDMRVRVSILDMYYHARDRFIQRGIHLTIKGFQAGKSQMLAIDRFLSTYPDIHFESCAEPWLTVPEHRGCISDRDLEIWGVQDNNMSVNPQNRNGCLCLSGKTELLGKRQPCAHNCAYCYWKDNS